MGPSAPKETPRERLKRVMAAQINNAYQRDSLAAAQMTMLAGTGGPGGRGGGRRAPGIGAASCGAAQHAASCAAHRQACAGAKVGLA